MQNLASVLSVCVFSVYPCCNVKLNLSFSHSQKESQPNHIETCFIFLGRESYAGKRGKQRGISIYSNVLIN